MRIIHSAIPLIICIHAASEDFKPPPFSIQPLGIEDYDHSVSYMAFGLVVNEHYSGLEVLQQDLGSGLAKIRLDNVLYTLKKRADQKISLKISNQTYTHKFVWSSNNITVEVICYEFLDQHDIDDPESIEEATYRGIMTITMGKAKGQFKVLGSTCSQ